MKPRALDLFGGEGLAALGYARAGFDVTTVELDPERIANHVQHPDIHVVKADATTYPLDGFHVVVGSPPCTDHSERAALATRARGGDAGTGWMLRHTLDRLRAWAAETGGLYVVENVEGAKRVMGSPLVLCGTMFGLSDEGWHLERHRLFESNAPLMAPGPHRCRARGVRGRIIGVYGDLTANDRLCGGRKRPGGGMRAGVERARRLMGAPWASARGAVARHSAGIHRVHRRADHGSPALGGGGVKRGEPPKRKTPLTSHTNLRRRTPLQQSAESVQPGARALKRSTITRKAPMRMSAPRDLGPTSEVVEAVVDRDRLSCVRCGYGIGPNERGRRWSLHHRKRRSQGGEHTVQNLILLCGGSEAGGCHGWVHGNPDEAREAGWLLKARWEPLAVPVLIPLEDRLVYLGADGLYRDVREAS